MKGMGLLQGLRDLESERLVMEKWSASLRINRSDRKL